MVDHTSHSRVGAAQDRQFLNGGGELGALIRGFDWTQTPLGPPEDWPLGLKTAVRIMLTSRQPMWIGWGSEFTYLYNDAYKSIIGGKHPVALGQPASVVWREIWTEIGPRLRSVLESSEGTYDEALLLIMERHGYPEETYYTFSYSPVPDADGQTGGIICANTDDTARVTRERQLALLRQLATTAGEARTVPDACDLAGRALGSDPRDLPYALLYLLDDEGGQLRLAASSAMPADHPAAPLVAPVDNDGPWPFASALGSRGLRFVDAPRLQSPMPSGPWDRPADHAAMLPLAGRGQHSPSGLLVLGLSPYRMVDDSYRGFLDLIGSQVEASLANAAAYEEERRRAEALAEVDRAKTAFFSNVSHEFRTPLTLILGPLDDLRQSPVPDVREQATVIYRNASRLLRLVNTLLEFSRIEAGRAQASFEAVDLAEYTTDLASTFRSAMERAELRFVVDCAPIGEPVYVDRQMWERVVLNLLSNAFKFTHQGEVMVRLRRVDGSASLEVTDTGLGISASELPKLFERFHRVEGARGRTHEGTGIGLALVHELVKLHGGRVSVTSELGRGTTFTVVVPLGRAHLPDDHVDESRGTRGLTLGGNALVEEALRLLPEGDADASAAEVEVPGVPLAERSMAARILLVDDNADMREYIARLLSPRWIVETAANGLQALDAVRRARPHLVVTDVMMPELDGFGLLRALREAPETSDIPVLMLSARAGEDARIHGLEAGADDYLVKPFSARELIARVDAQLLRARIRTVEESNIRRFASVLQQAPVAVALLRGPDHVYELANPSYQRLVNNRPLIGLPIRQALPEVEPQVTVGLLDEVYRSGQAYIGRSLRVAMNRGPDGALEDGFFDFVYEPLVDSAGRVEGIAVVAHDVTELARARQDAERANRAKDEFLAMLGHELRNPLAPILTALQLMRLRGPAGSDRESQVIERQVRHLVTLVDDLLDVSRITRGKVELSRAPVELAEVIAKAIETASPLLEQHQHELHVAVPRRGLMVHGDASRLTQVFSNLLANAAKYTNPHGTITVDGTRDGDQVVVRVRDTGIGIAPDILPQVFDLFVQEAQALDRAQGGLGLGLTIVRSLVRMHGGSVSAESDGPGQGATFTVRLPAAQLSAETPATDEPAGPAPAASARRILIVDDNADAAEMLTFALSATGFAVRSAHDGPTALEVAREFHPDVALVDLGLPVMDGYELARQWAADPAISRTRLVALTGYGQERDRRRTQEAGFAAHLVKPVDLDVLRGLIARLLELAPA